MKRIAALTLLLVLLATPAFAALKMLEASLAQELEALAKESAASSHNVLPSKVTIEDPWLLELFNIKAEIYIVPMVVDKVKTTVYVQVDTKTVLSEEDLEALRAEDAAKAPEEPVFRTLAVGMDTEDAKISVTSAPQKKNYIPYALGFVGLVVLGTGASVLKARLS